MDSVNIEKGLDRLFTHEVINGNDRCEYLHRWILFVLRMPKNWLILNYRRLRVGSYLHKFIGSDWSRMHHDHPQRFVSIGLFGTYIEEVLNDDGTVSRKTYRAPWVRSFPARHRHRVILVTPVVWTLVFVFPAEREWGFWRNGKWIHWKEYVHGPHADADKDC